MDVEPLAAALVHHHNIDPKSGPRNFGDIQELFDRFPAYFVEKRGEVISSFFMQADNARGGSDSSTRFAATLFFITHDLDALVIACQSGGHSKYNPVEKVNVAISQALHSI